MIELLHRDWWVFLLRGILALLFAAMVLVWPGATVVALVYLFGVFALVDGLFALTYAFVPDNPHRFWSVMVGIAGIAIGYFTFRTPGLTAIILYLYVAAWAIVGGVASIVVGARIRRYVANEVSLIIGGALAILFGILLIALPQVGVVSLLWLISLLSLVTGVAFLSLAIRLRHLGRHPTPPREPVYQS